MSQTFEVIRRRTLLLESEIDTKIISLSKFASASQQVLDAGVVENLIKDLEELLQKLNIIVNVEMNELQGSNNSVLHALQRHREIYNTCRREFIATKGKSISRLQHHSLLGDVQREIREAQTGGQYYLDENRRALDANNQAEEHVSVAINMYEQLLDEGRRIRSGTSTLGKLTEKMPGLNTLMRRIGVRKQRDQLILAGVIAGCIAFSFIYVFLI